MGGADVADSPASLQHEGEGESLCSGLRGCRIINPKKVRHRHSGALEVPLLHELVLRNSN